MKITPTFAKIPLKLIFIMSSKRRFILADLILEVAFWLGGLLGFLAGLFFAQKKGADLRRDIYKKWNKGGFKEARTATTNEIKNASKEAWKVTRAAVTRTEAYKKSAQKADEIWQDIDPETKAALLSGLQKAKKAASKTAKNLSGELQKTTKKTSTKARKMAAGTVKEVTKKATQAKKRVTKAATKTIKSTQKSVARGAKKISQKIS